MIKPWPIIESTKNFDTSLFSIFGLVNFSIYFFVNRVKLNLVCGLF